MHILGQHPAVLASVVQTVTEAVFRSRRAREQELLAVHTLDNLLLFIILLFTPQRPVTQKAGIRCGLVFFASSIWAIFDQVCHLCVSGLLCCEACMQTSFRAAGVPP